MSNTNSHIVELANSIIENGVATFPTKKITEDYNKLANLAGEKNVKKFASRAKAEERITKMAHNVIEGFGHLVVTRKEENVDELAPTGKAADVLVKTEKKTRKGLIVTVDGKEYKYADLRTSILKGAETIEYNGTPSESQKNWIEQSRVSKGRGNKKEPLVIDVDGKEIKWSNLKVSDIKNAESFNVASGTPTDKQNAWLAKYKKES